MLSLTESSSMNGSQLQPNSLPDGNQGSQPTSPAIIVPNTHESPNLAQIAEIHALGANASKNDGQSTSPTTGGREAWGQVSDGKGYHKPSNSPFASANNQRYQAPTKGKYVAPGFANKSMGIDRATPQSNSGTFRTFESASAASENPSRPFNRDAFGEKSPSDDISTPTTFRPTQASRDQYPQTHSPAPKHFHQKAFSKQPHKQVIPREDEDFVPRERPARPAHVVVSQHEAQRFLRELTANHPRPYQPVTLGPKISTENAKHCLAFLFDHSSSGHEQELLLWLLTQQLFIGSPSALAASNVQPTHIHAGENLLVMYWNSSAFSRDRIANASFSGFDTCARYLMVMQRIQSMGDSLIHRRLSEKSAKDVLARISHLIDQIRKELQPEYSEEVNDCMSNLGIQGDGRRWLLTCCQNIKEIIEGIQTAPAMMASPSGTNTIGADEDDAQFKQHNRTKRQVLDFRPTFRTSRVEPTLDELASDPPQNLRRITVGAPITSLEHHLDNVFHATRNDALQSLREAVQYLKANDMKLPNVRNGEKKLDAKVYKDLEVSDIAASPEFGVLFVFKSDYICRNRASLKRRLIPGSIVVLTHDNLKTGEICIITFSSRYETADGYICLRRAEGRVSHSADVRESDNDALGPLKNIYSRYTMVESSVYWESHVHSLKALQNMPCEEGFKGQDLLRHVCCLPGTTLQSFQLPNRTNYYDGHYEDEGSDNDWYDADLNAFHRQPTQKLVAKQTFTFDETQAKAFTHIFNSPAPVVQGPPGTGKSFIGVAAVAKMLSEYSIGGPILVVCYTNHALDSFLEDLIKEAPRTKLIRLGAQSKSENLSKYKLANGYVKGFGFDAARREMEECWRSARAENFIPTGQDIPTFVTQYFEALKVAKAVAVSQAKEEVGEAREERLSADTEVPDTVVYEIKAILNLIDPQHERHTVEQCTKLIRSHRGKDAKDAYFHRNMLKDYPSAVYFALNVPTPRQLDADAWLADAEFQVEEARRDQLNFLVSWRDEKGKVAKKVSTISEVPDEAVAVEEGADIAELNVDQLQEETAAVDQSMTQAPQVKHQHKSIRTVAVTRPSYLLDDESVSLDALNAKQRSELYDYFTDARLRSSQPQLLNLMIEVNDAATMRRAAVAESHIHELRGAQVIGATTTGLSKHLLMMAAAKVRCVVLEEAAEIPECHALTAILPDVRHFIQIGDHQQLRPKISCLGSRKLNLNISLMERMLNVNNSCKTLAVQRRMRTEIADFIRPFYDEKLASIGTSLRDHECVEAYPTDASHYGLYGSNGFVLYVNHEFPESESKFGTSYENVKEAEFAVAAAVYVSKQQPKASITILVPYTGQLLCVNEITKRYKFLVNQQERRFRVVSIDDFQGEESDVVILCLTRSNSPGFFREDNRICVALSRARHLQIVVGNFKCFKKFTESVWPAVLKRASETRAGIRNSLRLECTRHGSEREFAVGQDPADCMSPLYGCKETCGMKRRCGHVCEALCHANTSCDEAGKCTKPCRKVGEQCGRPATCQHECTNRCSDPCGQCLVSVDTVCGCGTNLTVACHQLKAPGGYYRACPTHLKIDLACGHTKTVSCYAKHVEGKIECEEFCKQKHTDCGHTCRHKCKSCFEPNHGDGPMWVHAPCIAPCARPLVCGHLCQTSCSTICPPCTRVCEYSCEHHKTCLIEGETHACGQPNQCVPCQEPCQNSCEHSQCTKSCHQTCDRKPCDLQCECELKCGHRCRGMCGEPCLTRCFECKPWDDNVDGIILGSESTPGAAFIELKCGHFFETGDLDHYIEISTDYTVQSIAYPKCPQCTQLIMNVKRYKGKLNEIRHLVNQVKEKAIARLADAEKKFKVAVSLLKTMSQPQPQSTDRAFTQGYNHGIQPRPFIHVPYLEAAIKLTEQQVHRLQSAGHNLQLSASLCRRIELLNLIFSITAKDAQYSDDGHLGNRAMNDGIKELTALVGNSSCEEMDSVVRRTFVNVLATKGLRSDDDLNHLAVMICKSRPRGLTEADKKSIRDALVVNNQIQPSGAFKKCPCGYIYVVGDCGGAMAIGSCPECRRPIGGNNHRDVDGVTHTGEFDGSSRAAWS